ncbi:MAG: GNAT family N-acetyltransferase, partial [Pyrinomonadaceae bacterium]|nr:GNAT family N-acetyltransferase [Pyrinomonadaceae bacterium]
MKDQFEISAIHESDIDQVKLIEGEAGLSVWPEASYLKLIRNEHSICLKIKTNKDGALKTVGFIVSQILVEPEDAAGSAEIYNISVLRAKRRKGFGAALIDRLIS